jgi:hypothetical protein
MADKPKVQKPKPPKQKVIRYKPNINLLKHLNAILLVTGFVASLFTVFLLSSKTHTYDVRSRGQEMLTPTPTPPCPTGACPLLTPTKLP